MDETQACRIFADNKTVTNKLQMDMYIRLLMMFALLLQWGSAYANYYAARVDVAEWVIESSPFMCRMKHPVPYYGEGVFEQRAGEDIHFYLHSRAEYMAKGQAVVAAKAPPWQPERPIKELGLVSVIQSQTPLHTSEALAMSLLDELKRGMVLQFQRRAWYDESEKIEVEMSPVQFQAAYRAYSTCLAQLLPENFEQLQRSTLLFATGKYDLLNNSRQTLDHVIAYLKADPAVTALVVDGHTDSVGDRENNLILAKRRAEAASQYLVAAGVDPARITTRFHGERFPLAPNSNASGRQKNRRVTIQLEKDQLVSAAFIKAGE